MRNNLIYFRTEHHKTGVFDDPQLLMKLFVYIHETNRANTNFETVFKNFEKIKEVFSDVFHLKQFMDDLTSEV